MSISLDTTGSNSNGGTSPLSFSYSTSGSDRNLFVAATGAISASNSITGITYNSIALTKIAEVRIPSDRWISLWHLVNPASGSNTLSVSSDTTDYIGAAVVSYDGVLQSGSIIDAITTNTGTSITSLTTSVTTIADNCWTILCAETPGGATAAGTGSNLLITLSPDLYDSNGPKTPAGSTSMQVTRSGSGSIATIMASFAPSATTTSPSKLALLGVG